MRHDIRTVLLVVVLVSPPPAWAQPASDVKALQDAKALLDAQAARDVAEAAAIKAASDLAKAKAAAADVATEIQKSQADAAAALTKAQIAAQTASIDALKSTFGAPPAIGTDGNLSITDAATGVLLEIKTGSLDATWLLAQKLCSNLAAAGVRGAFFAPGDLDTRIQGSRMVLREFNALVDKVHLRQNTDLVGLTGAKAEVAPAAVLGAVSLLQYGAGALQTLTKMFRSDYAVGLSTDATRATWLEYFMVAQCPGQVPRAQLEAVVRNQSIDDVLRQFNELMDFYNAALANKSGIQKQIELLTARITALKAEKQPTDALQKQLDAQNDRLVALAPLDQWVPRIQTLVNAVSTTPGPFLDALTWSAFGDEKHPLKISDKPRLTAVLTTQDGQVTRTFWLTGKKVYGRSAGEVTYRVVKADGSVVTVGYLTATSSVGKIDFKTARAATTSGVSKDR